MSERRNFEKTMNKPMSIAWLPYCSRVSVTLSDSRRSQRGSYFERGLSPDRPIQVGPVTKKWRSGKKLGVDDMVF